MITNHYYFLFYLLLHATVTFHFMNSTPADRKVTTTNCIIYYTKVKEYCNFTVRMSRLLGLTKAGLLRVHGPLGNRCAGSGMSIFSPAGAFASAGASISDGASSGTNKRTAGLVPRSVCLHSFGLYLHPLGLCLHPFGLCLHPLVPL